MSTLVSAIAEVMKLEGACSRASSPAACALGSNDLIECHQKVSLQAYAYGVNLRGPAIEHLINMLPAGVIFCLVYHFEVTLALRCL